ncbi:MAG: beta-ketoacyl-[acyl-carrier-protein] synthase II, partial [Clostridiales Family XIII bacterium]|nr:beta-ketoacyl-[acyl-carrier-protein] synthase II [Clostridiales Family XIII bacterium]
MNRQVVITGMGIVSPVGNDLESAWDSIKNGRHGFSPITRFNVEELKVSINAEVKNFSYEDKREARR